MSAPGVEPTDGVLAYEAKLLRETVTDQRARINELETALEKREGKIAEQEARIKALEARCSEEQPQPDPETESGVHSSHKGRTPWWGLTRWLSDR